MIRLTAKNMAEIPKDAVSGIFPLGRFDKKYIWIDNFVIDKNEGSALVSKEKVLSIVNEALNHEETIIVLVFDDISLRFAVDLGENDE